MNCTHHTICMRSIPYWERIPSGLHTKELMLCSTVGHEFEARTCV